MSDHGVVAIRAVEDDDVETFFAYEQEPDGARMAAFTPRDREPFLAHWARIRADPTVVTTTVLVDGHVAGNIVSWDAPTHREVGYWIGQAYWGRGVATAALGLFLAEYPFRPLHGLVATGNAGSIRVLEKCGFRRVDTDEEVYVELVLDA
ncbi:N-acetyltransferase [Longispora fulva]|uniref:RimJ/RimL family protein N-acetyltransferase n=1 Tax=Longispora fulva TaxID=619741 RepID=A0A8J7KV06_9ACTN|nr:GNAT family N-acetyltransferase [Longispora fulva]MBG6134687.1 RimJ/RimL family protein N-acetyltransferase [Longispora fulva]GIG61895.1 N-acetyltransferase [Longispora fulva]